MAQKKCPCKKDATGKDGLCDSCRADDKDLKRKLGKVRGAVPPSKEVLRENTRRRRGR